MSIEPAGARADDLVVLEDVSVRYGSAIGIESVSLHVGPGEAVALVGPNGAGKTTTLRAIAGFMPRDSAHLSGHVFVAGRRVDGRRPWDISRQGVTMIPAVTKVFRNLSVQEHLKLALPPKKSPAAIDAALDLFPRLRDRLKATASALSGGERQMLAIAAATLGDPKILLVDELSQGLAPATIATVVAALRDLNHAGLTVLLVEQALQTALEIADRCYALESGRIVEEGPAAQFSQSENVQATYLGRATSLAVSSRERDAPTRIVVDARNVSVRFGGLKALSDVSLEVNEGECFGLAGPNGAGKTTLLNCISGAVRPQEGEIEVLGQRVSQLQPHRLPALGIARTFQSAHVWNSMHVLDIVALGTHHRHLSRREAVDEAHWALGVVGLSNVDPVALSDLPYGHAKLVDLARALASRPRVLLLDEPASGLASDERTLMARLIVRIGEELQITRVLVEHDLQMVRECCDRLAVLSHGRLIASGEPEEVLADATVGSELLGMGEAPDGAPSGSASDPAPGGGALKAPRAIA